MVLANIHVEDPWIWDGEGPKTDAQKFFEAYGHAATNRTFGESITKWYGDLTVYRSETGAVFYGAQQMKDWMNGLFFNFEKVGHTLESYLEIPQPNGTFKLYMTFWRQLWMKGNTGQEPDTNTPISWICTVGPAKGGDGYLGLHFHDVQLFWDKTKTVQLLGKRLPSDK